MSNSRPQMNYSGIKQPPQLPQTPSGIKNLSSHVGLSFFMASKGTEAVQSLNADEVTNAYGTDLFTLGQPHYTHQTKFLGRMVAHGSKVVTKRITLPGAAVATLCLAVEVAIRNNPVYVRNSDGSVQTNPDGTPVTNGTMPGVMAIWRVIPYSGLGLAAIHPGQLGSVIGLDGQPLSQLTINGATTYTQTTVLPIMDIEMAWKGGRGNNFALGLTSVNSTNADPITSYRPFFLSLMENNTPLTLMNGEQSIPFTFDINHLDANGNATDIGAVVAAHLGDLGRSHVYLDNLNMVRGMILVGEPSLFNGEGVATNTDLIYPQNDPRNGAMVDILSGTTLGGVPYYEFTVDAGNFGGIIMDGNTPIPFSSGTDAYPTLADGSFDHMQTLIAYDLAVRAELVSIQTAGNAYSNTARLPFRVFWDSGYAMKTKFAAMAIKNTRPEVNVIITSFSVVDVISTFEPPVIVVPPCAPDTVAFGLGDLDVIAGDSLGIRYQINDGPILQTWYKSFGSGGFTQQGIQALMTIPLLPPPFLDGSTSVAFTRIPGIQDHSAAQTEPTDFTFNYVDNDGAYANASIVGNVSTAGVPTATTLKFLASPDAVVGSEYGFNRDLYPILFGSGTSTTIHSCSRIPVPSVSTIVCDGAINEAALTIKFAGGTYDFIVNGTALYSGLPLNQLYANLQINDSATFDVKLLSAAGSNVIPPTSSVLLAGLHVGGMTDARYIVDGGGYVLYIRNKATASKRIRMINHRDSQTSVPSEALGVNVAQGVSFPVALNNITAGYEEIDPSSPSVYVCLEATLNISCVGATTTSGQFTLSGHYGIYLNGIRIAANVDDTAVASTLSAISGISVVDQPNGVIGDSFCITNDYQYYIDTNDSTAKYAPTGTDTDGPGRIWWELSVDDTVKGIATGGDITLSDAALDQVATYGATLYDFVENIPNSVGLAGGYSSVGSWLQNLSNTTIDVQLHPLFNVPVIPLVDSDGNSSYVQDPVTGIISVTLAAYSGTPHSNN